MGVMRYGRALAAAAVVAGAGVAGRTAGTRHVQAQQSWAEAILAADERLLRSGQPLPPIPEPTPPTQRKDKGIVRCYLTGIIIGGVGTWLITLLVLLALTTAGGEDVSFAERLMSSQLYAFIAGLIGFVFPGIVIGAVLYLAEKGGQTKNATAHFRHEFWQRREELRSDLATGRITVPQAVAQLNSSQ
jgi:hypothetical protein